MEQVTTDGKFRLVNDPGAWGAADPRILVLGISKGNTQARAYAAGVFDSVAFKNCRERLKTVLIAVGALGKGADIDAMMTASEQDYAFGSVVRCSVTGLKNGAWKGDAPVVLPAFRHQEGSRWLASCMRRYLQNLPSRLRLILLAGNSEPWIRIMRDALRETYPQDYSVFNSVACRAGGKVWAHVGHPSPLNGFFNEFVSGEPDYRQGLKRELAAAAVRHALAEA